MGNIHTAASCLYYFYNRLRPPSIKNLTWVDDYCLVELCHYSDSAIIEIWESVDGINYSYLGETNPGEDFFKAYTYQNANARLICRAKNNDNPVISNFSEPEIIKTPLVFKNDQSVLDKVMIQTMNINGGGTVKINWGDGTENSFTGNNVNIEHTYTVTGIYFITFSGDLNNIFFWDYSPYNDGVWHMQHNAFGDLTKWILPASLGLFHWYDHSFTGNIEHWTMPDSVYALGIFHVRDNNFSGDLSTWQLNLSQVEMRLTSNHLLTGDISGWILPYNNGESYFYIKINDTGLSGDLTGWVMPINIIVMDLSQTFCGGDISGWSFPNIACSVVICNDGDNTWFTGDLTGWTIAQHTHASMGYVWRIEDSLITGNISSMLLPGVADSLLPIYIQMKKSKFTNMPRGEFCRVKEFNFLQNSCDAAEIENFLVYVDNYFVGATVPLQDCIYELSGIGMGIASPAALAAKASIEAKYTAAGKTATINVN